MANNKKVELVTYRGRKVIKGWPHKIALAQMEEHVRIGKGKSSKLYKRIPFTKEQYPDHENGLVCMADLKVCHDCAIDAGQLHVPGCDVEQCPKCKGQMFICACPKFGPT